MIEILLDIQQNLEATKNQYNSFGKYKYRSCEGILQALKPHLKKHNAVILFNDEIVEVAGRHYLKTTAMLKVAGKEGITATAYAREEEEKKGMDASQITGASSSYARKYALNALFAIDDMQDSDATNTHGKEAPADKPAPSLEEFNAKVAELKSYKELSAYWQTLPASITGDEKFKEIINKRRTEVTKKS